MIKVFDTDEEFRTYIRDKHKAAISDFINRAKSMGLDPDKNYDFLCLSFNCPLKPEMISIINNWPVGPVRGYTNSYGTLCLNIPVNIEEDDEEEIPENENIYKLVHNINQEYFDLESSNWECYVHTKNDFTSIDDLMKKWNENHIDNSEGI